MTKPARGKPSVAAELRDLRRANARFQREIEAFRRVTSVFASLADVDETRANLAATIAGLLDAERCMVVTIEPGTEKLVARSPGHGWTPAEIAAFRLKLTEPGAATGAWLDGRPYFSNNPRDDPRNLHWFVRDFGERNLLHVPLRVGDRTVALIRVSNRRGDFTPEDVELVQAIGTPAALALDNARLYQAMSDERERLAAIFQNASDGIVIVDAEDRVISINPALEHLCGWTAGERIGGSTELYRQMLDARPAPYFETRLSARDGSEHVMGVGYAFIRAPGSAGALHGLAVLRDISPAQEVERLKSQFLSTISHELRTPLTAIRASVGVLRDYLPENFTEPLRRLVSNIDRSSVRLETLITGLHDLARLQNGQNEPRPEPVDSRQVIAGAVSLIQPVTDAKDQTVEIVVPNHPVILDLDRLRIEQVLVNLLANACKFSPPGSPIAVGLTERESQTRFWVRDRGPGINDASQPRIFDRFNRLTGHDPAGNSGDGLGLAIAKAIVDQHGGQIGLTSQPGAGSTFWFDLPKEPRR